MDTPELTIHTNVFPAVVAEVIRADQIVINKGSADGINIGQRLLVYEGTGREIIDPVTQESLGVLELPKGTGRVTYVLEHMAVVESDRTRPATARDVLDYQRSVLAQISPLNRSPSVIDVPFDNPQIGDKVKPI